MEQKKMNYLPNGSVVVVKEHKSRIMIYGRLVKKEGEQKIYDYVGCRYPQGSQKPDDGIYFNHDDIEFAYFLGFQDMEELMYREMLKTLPTHPENTGE